MEISQVIGLLSSFCQVWKSKHTEKFSWINLKEIIIIINKMLNFACNWTFFKPLLMEVGHPFLYIKHDTYI